MKFNEKNQPEALKDVRKSLEKCFESEECIIFLACKNPDEPDKLCVHSIRFEMPLIQHLNLLYEEAEEIIETFRSSK